VIRPSWADRAGQSHVDFRCLKLKYTQRTPLSSSAPQPPQKTRFVGERRRFAHAPPFRSLRISRSRTKEQIQVVELLRKRNQRRRPFLGCLLAPRTEPNDHAISAGIPVFGEF
jgi:hypothetical protein